MGVRARVAELIQSTSTQFRTATYGLWRDTKDYNRVDYRFWDRARRCKVPGLEVSGAFLKPLQSKVAAWVMGSPPSWVLDNEQSLQDKLNDWWRTNYSDVARGYEESVGVGDAGIIINPDLSVSVIPGADMTPIKDPLDPSQIMGWTLVDKYTDPLDPEKSYTIVDEYTAERRRRTITVGNKRPRVTIYPNYINRVPVIMVSNLFGVDEMFGRAEALPILPILQRYGEVIDAAIKGNIRQGRPTPTFEKMGTAEQIKKFWDKFGRQETRTFPDGTTETTTVIDFDPDKVVTVPGDATFNWKSPSPFTGDTKTLLEILFYALVQNTEIPEFVWGASVGASKASTETQFEPFVKWIEKRRGRVAKWMIDISDIVVRYLDLTTTGPVKDLKIPLPAWRKLLTEDGRLTLDTVSWAHGEGLITDELAASLIPVHVPDPSAEVAKAGTQWKDREKFKASLKPVKAVGQPGSAASPNKTANPGNATGNRSKVKPSGQPAAVPNGRPSSANGRHG